MTDVMVCSCDDERWAQLPAVLDAPIPDGSLLDDPDPATLWHVAWTWRATGDTTWWPHPPHPTPPTCWALTP